LDNKIEKPVAKLVPYCEDETPRQPGYWQDRVVMSPDFDDLPAEIDAAFDHLSCENRHNIGG
jgi:hypothetical protein